MLGLSAAGRKQCQTAPRAQRGGKQASHEKALWVEVVGYGYGDGVWVQYNLRVMGAFCSSEMVPYRLEGSRDWP